MADLYKLDLRQHLKQTEHYCYPIRTTKRCKAITRQVPCLIQRLLIGH